MLITSFKNKFTKRCKACDRSALFLAITDEGLCSSCEITVWPELKKRTTIINEYIVTLKTSRDTASKLKKIKSIIEHAQALAQFEEIGFTFAPSASSLLSKFTLLRNDTELEALEHAFEALRKSSVIKTTEQCLIEARTLLWKIGETKRQLSQHAELDRLAKRIEKFLRSNQDNPVSSNRFLVSEKNILEAPKNQDTHLDDQQLDAWFDSLMQYGYEERDLQTWRKKLAAGNGKRLDGSEVIRELLTRIIDREFSQLEQDFKLLQRVYHSMAVLAEQDRKPHLHVLVESKRMLLMSYRQRGVQKVQLLTQRKERCQICESRDREIISVREALETMPLPCENCPFLPDSQGRFPLNCTYIVSLGNS